MTAHEHPEDAAAPSSVITPDEVKATLDRVRSGRILDLSVPIAPGTPRMAGGQSPYFMTLYTTPEATQQGLAAAGIENDVGFALERVEMDLHTGTHVDALGHVAIGDAMYGGRAVSDVVRMSGLSVLGAEEIPSFISRGVLLDVAAVAGVESLPLGHTVSADELRAALSAADLTLQRGDVVLVNTGWLGTQFQDAAAYPQMGYPGLGLEAAELLIEGGALAIGADNISVEALTLQAPPDIAGVHKRCLADAGVFLIENVVTSALAEAKVSEFAFVCAPVKFQGGTAAPARPLAIM
jgi:kynurenine formamidase